MGNCFTKTNPVPVQQVGQSLNTGDVILLTDESLNSSYLTKTGKGWIRASITGFLVRDGPGSKGLTLYHADHITPDGCKVVAVNLEDELRSGLYRRAYVRRLHNKLTPEQLDILKQFASLNVNKTCCQGVPPPATILQANMAGSLKYERVTCSQFVATALTLISQIQPSRPEPGTLDYAAVDKKGYVLCAPRPLKVKRPHSPTTAAVQSLSQSNIIIGSASTASGDGSSPRMSNSSAAVTSPSSAVSPRGDLSLASGSSADDDDALDGCSVHSAREDFIEGSRSSSSQVAVAIPSLLKSGNGTSGNTNTAVLPQVTVL